jgi:hypothetical protein
MSGVTRPWATAFHTQGLWSAYPPGIRQWISQRGGQTESTGNTVPPDYGHYHPARYQKADPMSSLCFSRACFGRRRRRPLLWLLDLSEKGRRGKYPTPNREERAAKRAASEP